MPNFYENMAVTLNQKRAELSAVKLAHQQFANTFRSAVASHSGAEEAAVLMQPAFVGDVDGFREVSEGKGLTLFEDGALHFGIGFKFFDSTGLSTNAKVILPVRLKIVAGDAEFRFGAGEPGTSVDSSGDAIGSAVTQALQLVRATVLNWKWLNLPSPQIITVQ